MCYNGVYFFRHILSFLDSLEKIPFDLVFLVRLRYITKGLSLSEIIKMQHDGIEETPVEFLDIGSREKSEEMLKQAEQAGIHTLLHIPIILVMTIVVFLEEESLPKSKTGIYKTIYKLVIDRNTLKKFGLKSDDIPKMHDLLNTLGEFSWKALHQKLQPLLLKKVRKQML